MQRLLIGFVLGGAFLHAGILQFTGTSPASSTEGSSFSGALGTFTDGNAADTAATFGGAINWGDGTLSLPTFLGSNGSFTLEGTHTYAEDGNYTVTLNVNDGVGDSASIGDPAIVADAALTQGSVPSPLLFTPGVLASNILLMTFSDANQFAPASDFIGTLGWGDGTVSLATIIAGAPGTFSVLGSHTYAATGNFVVSIGVNDIGGSTVSAASQAVAVPEPGPIGLMILGIGSMWLVGRVRAPRLTANVYLARWVPQSTRARFRHSRRVSQVNEC